MNSALTRLYHDRRRLALVSVLAGLSGFLFYWRFGAVQVMGVPLPFYVAGLYALLVGLGAMVICLALPRLRFSVELFAVSRLILAAAAAVSPQVSGLSHGSPGLNATVVVGGGILLGLLLWGPRPAPTPGVAVPDHLQALGYLPDARGAGRWLHALATRPAATPPSRRLRLAAWIDDTPSRLAHARRASALAGLSGTPRPALDTPLPA